MTNDKRWLRAEERCQDILELLSWGESPAQIAARYGVSTSALSRSLRRHGHVEASCRFERSRWQERTSTCVDCSATVRYGSERCRACEGLRRRMGRAAA